MIKKAQSPLPQYRNKITDKTQKLAFSEAMYFIISGKKIRREEWSDPEEYCLLKDNFLMIHRDDKFHQWIVSEGDLMAIDWVVKK